MIKNIDSFIQKFHAPEKKPHVKVFYFHKLFADEISRKYSNVNQQQGTLVPQIREFMEFYLKKGFQFVGPDVFIKEDNTLNMKILITFDDGYFNNSLILPLLHEYKIPAVFFVCTKNILENESFWWDILFRMEQKGISKLKLRKLKNTILKLSPIQTKKILTELNSKHIYVPTNDHDRPFTADELKDFNKSDYVILGNHTSNHAILNNCNNDTIIDQIESAQMDFRSISDNKVKYFSYPNGSFSSKSMDLIKNNFSFDACFSTVRALNYLPLDDKNHLYRLNRFLFPKSTNVTEDLLLFENNYSLFNNLVNFYSKFSN